MATVASDNFSDNLFFASVDEHSVSYILDNSSLRPADTAIDNNNIIIIHMYTKFPKHFNKTYDVVRAHYI